MAYTQAVETKDGIRYRAFYQDTDGRYKSAGTYDTEERAQQVAEEKERHADELVRGALGQLDPVVRATRTIAGYTPVFLRHHRVEGNTKDGYKTTLRDQPARLAETYRLFLQLIGGGAGRFLAGSTVYYPGVPGLKEDACELLSENHSPFAFESSDRVFLMHQGYCFDFLRGSGPDPEVWSYSEGSSVGNVPGRTFERFTDWLRVNAEREIPVWAEYAAEIRRGTIIRREKPDGSISVFTQRVTAGWIDSVTLSDHDNAGSRDQ